MLKRALIKTVDRGGSTLCMVFLAVMVVGSSITLERIALAEEADKKSQNAVEVEVKKGRLRVVRAIQGREPRLRDAKGKHWLLTGALRSELLRLNNHRLKVWGVPGLTKAKKPTLRVKRYAIAPIYYKRTPLVGKLKRSSVYKNGLELVRKGGAGAISIAGGKAFLRRLRRYVGYKIWIVGDLDENTLKAFKFGWLRRKQKPIAAARPELKENRP